MTIIHATPEFFTSRRLRVRRVDEDALAHEAAASLIAKPRDGGIVVAHGGSVVNSYGYWAETEAVVAVAIDAHTVVLWGGRRPANKATVRGAASVADASDLFDFDGRVTERLAFRRSAARQALIARARIAAGCLPEAAIARIEAATL